MRKADKTIAKCHWQKQLFYDQSLKSRSFSPFFTGALSKYFKLGNNLCYNLLLNSNDKSYGCIWNCDIYRKKLLWVWKTDFILMIKEKKSY